MTEYAWHFCAAWDDGKPVLLDGTPLVVGTWLEHDDPKICVRGYHASRRAIDALHYARGSWVSMCEVEGIVTELDDQLVARRRRALWVFDAEHALREFARRCALDVIHLWDAPAIVREYLTTGDESLRAAAGDAVGTAVMDADGGPVCAASAARYAALFAVRESVWGTVWGSVGESAIAAARAAYRDSAKAGAWADARDAQNTRLEEMLLAGRAPGCRATQPGGSRGHPHPRRCPVSVKPAIPKPCPCGSSALIVEEGFLDDVCSITCSDCDRTTGDRESRADAVRCWNARNSDDPEAAQ